MRKFETLVLLSPELSSDNREGVIASLKDVIERNGGQIVEVAAPSAGGLDMAGVKAGKKSRQELRIVEVEFKENLWQ